MKKIPTLLLLTGLYFSPQAHGQTTYNDVASIFYAHCTSCHHTGGQGPFSLMNYSETSSMSSSIASDVSKGIMPPWHADTAYVTSGHKGQRFLQENVLTAVEKNAILKWVTDGAIEGNSSLAPVAPKYGDMKFKLNGTASLTLQIPAFTSNSTTSNSNPYNCFSLPSGLTEDRWLRAFEIVPGDFIPGSSNNIVHHVVVSVDTASSKSPSNLTGNCGQQPGQYGIGGWSAGSAPTVFPDGAALRTGIRIPAGSNFVLQIHYAPGSGGKIDSTKIRLFFYPIGTTGIRPMHSDVMLQNWGGIPGFNTGAPAPIPKDAVTTISAISTTSFLPAHTTQPSTDITLFAANPHSHNVCTKIKNYAYSNAGGILDTLPVISISNWDYNWQGNYYFPKLMKIPAGYTLKTEHVYNNTANNTHLTPGPRVDVRFGQATADEMLFDAFLWFDYLPGDENIDVKSLLINDPLLKVGINNIEATSIESSIYPNPASDNVTISLSKRSIYVAQIISITGQKILQTESFNDKLAVDVKNIPAGLYIVEIVDTKTNEKVSKKVVISN